VRADPARWDMPMITTLLIFHALLAVTLLGAITHQAVSIWLPARAPAGSFVARFRAVPGTSYANAVVLLYAATMALGAIIYPTYRVTVRIMLEQLRMNTANGLFELKEHFVVIGLALLPAYWYFWRKPLDPAQQMTRAGLTTILALIVWWSFVVGHILNNVRGFGS
jgi:hypothetical protein